jgi:uncharacterized damage-inducible protein DinB
VNFDDVRVLLDYHYWARDRLLDAADVLTEAQWTRDLSSSFRSVRDTIAHIYAADWVWYSRWRGESPTSLVDPAQFTTVALLRSRWTALESDVRKFVDELGPAGITNVIEYRLLNGDTGRSVFWQMLQHVVNHGSYHRGQATTLLRQLEAAPPKSTDLITFYRLTQTR